ncbi:unnamed protein product [Phytophthora lilii]|uniref:Unnamed protein product n=1 Tax=Phytophthora lilii TaxID=2077276 RepID=A0A9W6U083_9STRA|nr:unnamed protein product [Phytophthora lilii]
MLVTRNFFVVLTSITLQFSSGLADVVSYNWRLTPIQTAFDGVLLQTLGVNGRPSNEARIDVELGQDVEVHVTNELTEPTCLHWHGMKQLGTQDMDGIHHGTQYAYGLRGPLIVHAPKSEPKPWDEEYTIQLADIYHAPPPPGPVLWDTISINNRGRYNCTAAATHNLTNCVSEQPLSTFDFQQGKTYLLRLINMAAMATFEFSIDGHDFQVIAVDAEPVAPSDLINSIMINVGQRYDIIVHAKKETTSEGSFWMRAKGLTGYPWTARTADTGTAGFNYEGLAIVRYDSSSLSEPTTQKSEVVATVGEFDFTPAVPEVLPTKPDDRVVMRFNINTTVGTGIVSLDGGDFRTLVVPDEPPLFSIASGLKTADLPISANARAIEYGKHIEVILMNDVIEQHPFHLHSHVAWVVGSGFASAEDVYSNKLPPSKLAGPMVRDVYTVPPCEVDEKGACIKVGYTILRFKADNPGVWMMHCHIDWHMAIGMGMILVEGEAELQRQGPGAFSSSLLSVCKNKSGGVGNGGLGGDDTSSVKHDAFGRMPEGKLSGRACYDLNAVHKESETKPLAELSDEFFRQFSVVCLVGAEQDAELRLDALCVQFGAAFFAARSFGFDGLVFADLGQHQFRRSAVGADAAPSEPVTVQFPTLEAAHKVRWSSLQSARKRAPQLPKVFVKNQCECLGSRWKERTELTRLVGAVLQGYKSLKGVTDIGDNHEVDFIQYAREQFQANGLDEDYLLPDELQRRGGAPDLFLDEVDVISMSTALAAARAKTEGKRMLRNALDAYGNEDTSLSKWNARKKKAVEEGKWVWKESVVNTSAAIKSRFNKEEVQATLKTRFVDIQSAMEEEMSNTIHTDQHGGQLLGANDRHEDQCSWRERIGGKMHHCTNMLPPEKKKKLDPSTAPQETTAAVLTPSKRLCLWHAKECSYREHPMEKLRVIEVPNEHGMCLHCYEITAGTVRESIQKIPPRLGALKIPGVCETNARKEVKRDAILKLPDAKTSHSAGEGRKLGPTSLCGWQKEHSEVTYVWRCTNRVLMHPVLRGSYLPFCGFHASRCIQEYGNKRIKDQACPAIDRKNRYGMCRNHLEAHLSTLSFEERGNILLIDSDFDVPGIKECKKEEVVTPVIRHPLAPKYPPPALESSADPSFPMEMTHPVVVLPSRSTRTPLENFIKKARIFIEKYIREILDHPNPVSVAVKEVVWRVQFLRRAEVVATRIQQEIAYMQALQRQADANFAEMEKQVNTFRRLRARRVLCAHIMRWKRRQEMHEQEIAERFRSLLGTVKIQRQWRRYHRYMLIKRRYGSAQMIQSRVRGWLTRRMWFGDPGVHFVRNFVNPRSGFQYGKVVIEWQPSRSYSYPTRKIRTRFGALTIQRVFRGHLGRLAANTRWADMLKRWEWLGITPIDSSGQLSDSMMVGHQRYGFVLPSFAYHKDRKQHMRPIANDPVPNRGHAYKYQYILDLIKDRDGKRGWSLAKEEMYARQWREEQEWLRAEEARREAKEAEIAAKALRKHIATMRDPLAQSIPISKAVFPVGSLVDVTGSIQGKKIVRRAKIVMSHKETEPDGTIRATFDVEYIKQRVCVERLRHIALVSSDNSPTKSVGVLIQKAIDNLRQEIQASQLSRNSLPSKRGNDDDNSEAIEALSSVDAVADRLRDCKKGHDLLYDHRDFVDFVFRNSTLLKMKWIQVISQIRYGTQLRNPNRVEKENTSPSCPLMEMFYREFGIDSVNSNPEERVIIPMPERARTIEDRLVKLGFQYDSSANFREDSDTSEEEEGVTDESTRPETTPVHTKTGTWQSTMTTTDDMMLFREDPSPQNAQDMHRLIYELKVR